MTDDQPAAEPAKKKVTRKKSPAAPAAGGGDPLAAALLEAQRTIAGVHKDGKNTHHRYDYVTSEQMIAVSRAALIGAGVTLTVTRWHLPPSEPQMVEFVARIVHPESGQSHEEIVCWPVVPGNGRPWDKALAGALTTGLSYFLRGLLLIPRPDEEVDTRDDTGYKHQPAPKRQSPPKAPPAPPPPPKWQSRLDGLAAAICRKAEIKTQDAEKVARYFLHANNFAPNDLDDDNVYESLVENARALTEDDWIEKAAEVLGTATPPPAGDLYGDDATFPNDY